MIAANRLRRTGSALLVAALIVFVGFLTIRPWIGPHYPKLGPDFIYVKTETLGCEGSFCIEKGHQSTRYYYQTDMTLAQVIQFIKHKDLGAKNQQADTVTGIQETTVVVDSDGFLVYSLPTDGPSRTLLAGSMGKPLSKRAVVAIEATTADRLAEK